MSINVTAKQRSFCTVKKIKWQRKSKRTIPEILKFDLSLCFNELRAARLKVKLLKTNVNDDRWLFCICSSVSLSPAIKD
jgi:hypothetical protein